MAAAGEELLERLNQAIEGRPAAHAVLEAAADLANTVYERDKAQYDAEAISKAQLDAQDPTWDGNFGITPLNTTTNNGNAISGSRTFTCRTKTPMTRLPALTASDAGTTVPGSSRR